MELSKKERKKLIGIISKASGVAQYALEAKMSDDQVIEAAKYRDAFLLIKSANNFNRYCQAEKTAEANAKLKKFLNIENSELFKAGQWLLNSLSKTGVERKQSLLENNLVHKDDYNQAVSDLGDVINEQKYGLENNNNEAKQIIRSLENRIDTLLQQQRLIQEYIKNNQGISSWNNIQKYLQNNLTDEKAN
ncbi:MAG: hypothetical protein EAZ76_07960 [Nostocales cyanobacterium]|nr:MAG: hypothetical protein EAZ87_21280 [Nostocales cyanobacterium]TAF16107.1 MAG: hypothetical protein EAZ76_07960 [Nostocales cyanobacterium]